MCKPGSSQDIEKEVSMPVEEAARLVSKYLLPYFVAINIPFLLLHGFSGYTGITFEGAIWLLLLFVPGVVFHEILHGIVFGLLCKDGFRSISFGIHKQTYSPYCHCASPMSVGSYRAGALAPFLVLGLIPLVIGWFTGCLGFLVYGFLFSIFSGGDWLAVYLTKGLKLTDKIMDHPSKLGYFLLRC